MSPEQIGQILLGLAGLILGGGGAGAILEYKSRKKKEPIDQATAAAAISEKAGNLALAMAQSSNNDIRSLREEMEALREDNRKQRRDMDAMGAELAKRSQVLEATRSELRALMMGVREWYMGKVVNQWEIIRQQPVPPDPPLELRNWDSGYSSLINEED